ADIETQYGGTRLSASRNGLGNSIERLLAAGNEHELVSMRGEFMRERCADSGRGAGDHRDCTCAAVHRGGSPCSLATRRPSSMRSRDEMPRRSAARQIRLLSNSLT